MAETKINEIQSHKEISTVPSTPSLGYNKIYNRDGVWYGLDDAGLEVPLSGYTNDRFLSIENINIEIDSSGNTISSNVPVTITTLAPGMYRVRVTTTNRLKSAQIKSQVPRPYGGSNISIGYDDGNNSFSSTDSNYGEFNPSYSIAVKNNVNYNQ